jgi:hypothetical protein
VSARGVERGEEPASESREPAPTQPTADAAHHATALAGSPAARVLQLQRTLGNRAVQQLLGRGAPERAPEEAMPDRSGLELGTEAEEEDTDLGGELARQRTFGEWLGDLWRPIGAGLGNIVGGAAELLTGLKINTNTTTPAAWNNHMQFLWEVAFTTTGRSGWIVQEIVNEYRAVDGAGNAVGPVPEPHYWEAWAVDAAGTVTPANGATHDTWRRGSRGDNTKGHWSMKGKVYFTKTDPALHGFAAGGVPNAGGLLATTVEPVNLPLGFARLHRYAQGHWDSTGPVKSHTGSAGPL